MSDLWQYECIVSGCGEPRTRSEAYCTEHLAVVREGQPVGRGQSAMVCPHCQVRGKVRTEIVKVKRGVSGGKATGAVLTGGLSLFATGLARKEWITKARCGNCHQEWSY